MKVVKDVQEAMVNNDLMQSLPVPKIKISKGVLLKKKK